MILFSREFEDNLNLLCTQTTTTTTKIYVKLIKLDVLQFLFS